MILIKILLVALMMNTNEKELSAHGQWEDYYYELEQDKTYKMNTK